MRKRFGAAALILCVSSSAIAEPMRIELGWTNLPDCSRVVNSGSNLFGLPDTVQTAEQRFSAYVEFDDVPTDASFRQDVEQCARRAAGAATIAAILSDATAALPAFEAELSECSAEKAEGYGEFTLGTEDHCMW